MYSSPCSDVSGTVGAESRFRIHFAQLHPGETLGKCRAHSSTAPSRGPQTHVPPATPSPRALGATPSTLGLQRYVPSQTTLLAAFHKNAQAATSRPPCPPPASGLFNVKSHICWSICVPNHLTFEGQGPCIARFLSFFQFATDGLLRAAHLAPFPPSDLWSVLGDFVRCSDFQTHGHCIITELTIQLP